MTVAERVVEYSVAAAQAAAAEGVASESQKTAVGELASAHAARQKAEEEKCVTCVTRCICIVGRFEGGGMSMPFPRVFHTVFIWMRLSVR